MNWATIAPESRLYKGKDLFRWDVSPGLEHHCGICATPLNNSRAKSSCIGKHVEPCYRFHQQLHFIGRSHECFGCNHSDEMHHNRHKDILTLVRRINQLDEIHNPRSPRSDSPSLISSRRSSAQSSATSTTTLSEVSSECGEEGSPKIKRGEKKKAKKLGMGAANKKIMIEAFSKEDIDFVSEALHLSVHETKGGRHGTYIYHNKQPEAELTVPEVDEDDGILEEMVNLSVRAPGVFTPRQRRNSKKCTTTSKHSNYRGGSRKFSPNGISNDPLDSVDPQIFFRLNIEINPAKNTVTRKELFVKLVISIKNDLAILAQEDAESEMRAEGFWRWAGKSAWKDIMSRREGLDWATGQKIEAPTNDARFCYPDFVGQDANTITPNEAIEDGQPNKKIADDDPPGILVSDFSVKDASTTVKEKRVENMDDWAVVKTGKNIARKKRTDGGRVFVTKSAGGMKTLRISAS